MNSWLYEDKSEAEKKWICRVKATNDEKAIHDEVTEIFFGDTHFIE